MYDLLIITVANSGVNRRSSIRQSELIEKINSISAADIRNGQRDFLM